MTRAERIKALIEKSGKSYVELEKLTGVKKSSLQRYASGATTKIPLDVIEKLAVAFNVSQEYIMGWEEKRGETTAARPLPSNILPMPKMVKKPLLGTIACGTPILAVENIETEVDVPDGIKCDFVLRCKGDSMIDARIFDGDLVYLRQQEEVENGQIAAVLIDSGCESEATLKRVYLAEDRITLFPANQAYEPLVYVREEMNSVRIIGRAVAFTSMVR